MNNPVEQTYDVYFGYKNVRHYQTFFLFACAIWR